uniref:Uncharacterized protein n=1 Tax=Glossina morsitans morsitans TaxID=37546 RepID=A0A1B0FJX9_GLOMM
MEQKVDQGIEWPMKSVPSAKLQVNNARDFINALTAWSAHRTSYSWIINNPIVKEHFPELRVINMANTVPIRQIRGPPQSRGGMASPTAAKGRETPDATETNYFEGQATLVGALAGLSLTEPGTHQCR